MRSKEHFNGAAVADREEVTELYDYLARKILAKSFSKSVDESVYGLNVDSERQPHSAQLSPYHYLRTDLALLLGASGSKLLNKTWSKFRLSPNETNRARLRPCLVKLFSVAARIAAPRGIGHALKRLVSDFEKAYFCVVVDQDTINHKKTSRRFALLSVLQAGQGSHLLHGSWMTRTVRKRPLTKPGAATRAVISNKTRPLPADSFFLRPLTEPNPGAMPIARPES